MNKRTFLKNASLLSIGSLSAIPALGRWADAVAAYPETAGGSDEDYWNNIRMGYRLKPDYINLENGYYCIMPQETLNKYEAHIREVNLQGAYYMRTVQFENKAKAAKKLADLVGCAAGERGCACTDSRLRQPALLGLIPQKTGGVGEKMLPSRGRGRGG